MDYKCEVDNVIEVEELSIKIKTIHEFVTTWKNQWEHLDLPKYNKITKKGSWLKNIVTKDHF